MAFFFFFFNNEKRIGFKKLTSADLGMSASSNQTHIGLYEGVLDFLENTDVVKSAMLIYNDYCDILNCSFDRIKMPNGEYRSPKIKTGNDATNSIVYRIREFARSDAKADWYLAWTGLESEEIVFWLIKGGTKDYEIARSFFSDKRIIDESSPAFDAAKTYLQNRINFVSVDVQKDIEVKSQVGDKFRLYKPKDIERAEKLFKETGRKGEELIAEYLEKEKVASRIDSFVWENRSKESGLPYDFIINGKLFVDVKSTRFNFEQYLYFSDSEIDFITKKDSSTYSVYRVFDMSEEERKLRICTDCNNYMNIINSPIINTKKEIEMHNALLDSLKIGVKPNDCFVNIQEPITL